MAQSLEVMAALANIEHGHSQNTILETLGKEISDFYVYKFRSMRVGADKKGLITVGGRDPRITRTGYLIRKYKLDELPQLWSILVGDMSFVGPRPALFNQQDLIELRTQQGVHKLMPGLTGWAQVNGRDEIPIPDKVKLDAAYLRDHSIAMDIRILCMTLIKVVKRANVSH